MEKRLKWIWRIIVVALIVVNFLIGHNIVARTGIVFAVFSYGINAYRLVLYRRNRAFLISIMEKVTSAAWQLVTLGLEITLIVCLENIEQHFIVQSILERFNIAGNIKALIDDLWFTGKVVLVGLVFFYFVDNFKSIFNEKLDTNFALIKSCIALDTSVRSTDKQYMRQIMESEFGNAANLIYEHKKLLQNINYANSDTNTIPFVISSSLQLLYRGIEELFVVIAKEFNGFTASGKNADEKLLNHIYEGIIVKKDSVIEKIKIINWNTYEILYEYMKLARASVEAETKRIRLLSPKETELLVENLLIVYDNVCDQIYSFLRSNDI